ncbi:hypothetical protein BY458DRAFT_508279 [Sporodiniella umbellata]|nr:hypothetical protein BY458DRAFT_508279 [Sporodiniella umbellata]
MPAISQFFTGAKQLTIELIEPIVFFRVDAQDPSRHAVRGEVSVILPKLNASTSVILKLMGKSSIVWPEGLQGGKAVFEKTIHEQELILPTDSKTEAGLYRWPFQFLISNQLPETIEDDRGKVFYYLIATMHRAGFSSPLRARRDLLLLRTPHWTESPASDQAQEEHWPECEASIRLEKNACSSGTELPVILHILPKVKHLYLQSIRVSLTEKRVYIMEQTRRVRSQETKVQVANALALYDPPLDIQQALDGEAHLPLCEWPVHHRLHLMLPNCYHVNHSSTYDQIHIEHTLHIHLHLYQDSPIHIHFKTPITLLDCRLRDDYDVLPTYQQALLPAEISEEGFICPRLSLVQKKRKVKKRLDPPPPAYEEHLTEKK